MASTLVLPRSKGEYLLHSFWYKTLHLVQRYICPDTQIFEERSGSVGRAFDLGVEGLWVSRLTGGTLMCPWASLSSSSQAKGTKSTLFLKHVQAKGTKSTLFLTHVRKERSGLHILCLRRWFILRLVLVQPTRKTGNCPEITEKLLTRGGKASTQTKLVNFSESV